jgi:regulator of sirC expression with transglutaminase-like and TPR domain
MRPSLADALVAAAHAPGAELARAAHVIAQLEYPRLDPAPDLERLDRMGEEARTRLKHGATSGATSTAFLVKSINEYLFAEEGFAGNHARYEDPRNSCLNEVLDRRTGIPITLSLIYMEVGRRAGLRAEGVNFPGRFLVRVRDESPRGAVIVDPFDAGALLSAHDCRTLLRKHVGAEVAFTRSLLAPATPTQIIVRMLLNLKRAYVHMRSFPQARNATELLLALMPSALNELRDRGLLAYHLNDMSGALRDLQTYLKLTSIGEMDKQTRQEHQQIWEHVKTVRRRIASMN